MKATQLRGMPVVSISGAEKLGEVQDLVLNPDAQHVVAVRIKLSLEGVVKTVSALEVRVGHDAITIKDPRSATAEELTEVDGAFDLSRLLGTRVMSYRGNLLGNIEDVEIDTDLIITGYELGKWTLSDFFGGRRSLPAAEGIHYVKETLMVTDDGVSALDGGKSTERMCHPGASDFL
jgi:uncharacterized protein YrrD